MSATEPPPPAGENVIQRNIRLKVCAYCNTPGAQLKCEACLQRTYCNKKCQKKDWKTVHRNQCKKLQQVFVPPKPGWREAAAAGASDGGGGAAAAACGSGGIGDDDEVENPCPICLDNEDDAYVAGVSGGMCTACGQTYCGACAVDMAAIRKCPTCRAPFYVSDEEQFKRLWKLVHDRSPGRHTSRAQNRLGRMYTHGNGVKQDHATAVKWYRRAAEQGNAMAQSNLGTLYKDGKGVSQDSTEAIKWFRFSAAQGCADGQCNLGAMYVNGEGASRDFAKALKWWQLAAEQGAKEALTNLNTIQQHNLFPTPPPGTTITTVLLTSAAASKYNNTKGIVVAPPEGQPPVKFGRAAVLLEGEANPIAFKLMNLRRGQFKKHVRVPPPEEGKEAAAAAASGGGGGGGGGAAAAAGGGGAIADADEIENPCPICLDNEDDATVDGKMCGICYECGQMYCGACGANVCATHNCPTCRAPIHVSDEETFKRLWKLVHDRSPGRHTPHAQNSLGGMYQKGDGVKQDKREAVKWYQRAADQGNAMAQNNLGLMYAKGEGVQQDHTEAVKWYRLSAEQDCAEAQSSLGFRYANSIGVSQDFAEALKWSQLAAEQGEKVALANLNTFQQHNLFPTPPQGTTVTTILLTSAASAKYNSRAGIVVMPTEGTVIKPGRVAVLLDGEATPISLKLMNLRV